MKIYIKDIGPEGLSMNDQMLASEVGLTKDDHLYFISPLDLQARIEIVGNILLAKVTVSGKFSAYCYRTLEKVEREWSTNLVLDFPVDSNTDTIELDEDIRQEVVMRVPMRVLSDSEIEKDRERLSKDLIEGVESTTDSPRTHQPFVGLKDIE